MLGKGPGCVDAIQYCGGHGGYQRQPIAVLMEKAGVAVLRCQRAERYQTPK